MSTSLTSAAWSGPARVAGPALLGATALGAVALVLVVREPARVPSGAQAAVALTELQASAHTGLREPLPVRPAARAEGARAERPRGPAPRARALYTESLAELARTPEALEAHVRAQLAPDAPADEQVVLLAFLRERRWPSALAWHEYAVRTGRTTSDASGVGLAEVALGALAAEANHSTEAALALERLAFEADELPAGLRRRAACAFAATTDAAGLLRLEAALVRARDPVLVEGCLVAVAARPPDAARARLLAVHGREPGEPTADVE